MGTNNLRVPYGLAVHGKEEEKRVLRVIKQKRTILGKETKEFEKRVASIFGNEYGVMVNSGSSANLLAVELLNLPKGSEVITPILTFSTTVSPLIKNNLMPVFVDVEEGSYVANIDQIKKSITKKTKALMIPLLLGNVPNLKEIYKIAKKYNLYVILDSCDTLGATFDGKKTGEFADICTTSFYGSHIITAGGGGGMMTFDIKKWNNTAKILRGWGRGSASLGESEDPNLRFKIKLAGVPYDSKFIFSEVGYNFLPMEIGSAFGNAQLGKLGRFRRIRRRNFLNLLNFFQKYSSCFITPRQDKLADTQWLAFPITIKAGAPFTRFEIVSYLEKNNIQTRPIFTGIITKQPGFKNMIHKSTMKKFPVTQAIMERGFLIGCHQGLEEKHLNRLKSVFSSFLD